MKWAVFDIDGTISDDRWRRHLLPKDGKCDKDFDAYHEQAFNDSPFNLEHIQKAYDEGCKIAFITTRPRKYRTMTLEWLRKHVDLPEAHDWAIAMRPERNKMPSPMLKELLIDSTEIEWSDIVLAWDDREDVRAMYRKHEVIALRPPEPPPLTTAEPVQSGVGESLRAMAATFDERGEGYGDAYLRLGPISEQLWPDGLTLRSHDDFVRYSLVIMCIGKLLRYCSVEGGHIDSAHDLGVYAAMLETETRKGN